eukprot:3941940-Rhodomonas_salina.4
MSVPDTSGDNRLEQYWTSRRILRYVSTRHRIAAYAISVLGSQALDSRIAVPDIAWYHRLCQYRTWRRMAVPQLRSRVAPLPSVLVAPYARSVPGIA